MTECKSDSADELSYAGVVARNDRLIEMAGASAALVLKRDGIGRIRLEHGLQAERPILGTIFGLCVLGLGLFPLAILTNILSNVAPGAPKHAGYLLSLLAFIPFGIYCIRTSLRRGYFLYVEDRTGWRKLSFQATADSDGVTAFVRNSEEQFGYAIDRF